MHWAWAWAARRGGAETITRASRDASEARSEVAARSLLSKLLLQPLEFIYLISIAGLFQINILDILTLTLLFFFPFFSFFILSLYFSPWPGWGAKTWHQGHGLGWTRSALPWGCCACSNLLSLQPIAAAVLCTPSLQAEFQIQVVVWNVSAALAPSICFLMMYSISCNFLFSLSYLGRGLGSKRRE